MKYFLTLVACLIISSAFAQFGFANSSYKNKDLEWMGMITFDEEMIDIQKLLSDDDGNTFVVARFQWEMHLGVPAGKRKSPEPPKVSAENSFGIFIQKIAPDQSIVFTKVFKLGDRKKADLTSTQFNTFTDVSIVGSDLYMTGSFEFDADFGDNITLKSNGRNDMFVVKIDGSGKTQWAIQGGGSGNVFPEMDPGGLAVTADLSGENVYAVARLNAYPKGGGLLDGKDLELSKDGATMVLMKISKQGKVLWFKKAVAGTGGSNPDLSLDGAGNIYISGATMFFLDWEEHRTKVTGLGDAFVMKLDPDGKYIWGKVLGASNLSAITFMSVDKAGNISLMGSFDTGDVVEGHKVIKPKPAIMDMANVLFTMDTDGNVTSFNQIDGKDFMDLPTFAFQGKNGDLIFRLGGKAKINDEKVKDLGYYVMHSSGEIEFIYNPTYSSPAYLFLASGIEKTDDSMYMMGKLMKASDFAVEYGGAKSGAMIEKQINKKWVYKRDLDIGLLLLKLNIN